MVDGSVWNGEVVGSNPTTLTRLKSLLEYGAMVARGPLKSET